MWRNESYKGFLINVLPVLKHNPEPGQQVPYGYTGYVNRPGAVIAVEANIRRFTHPSADFPNEAMAAQAAFEEGRSIIDRTHSELTIDGL
ncbi:hypothetical protein [Burkholderia sp. Ac-20349]|uniref:hypothetical protein n=1 Tax=Burkholderia sp. Ac-20349 TaxID=2703893 RepID=UPI00197B90A3|nr:hypothetical protein [Burkholderia sp. Ac-20349]MBN3838871.1 hypothetical protein [Burkholderia sp. Ac-20349]